MHEQHAAGITQRVQQLCREAEEVARRIVAQSQELERRIAEQASVTSAVLDSRVRKQEEAFSAQQEKLNVTAGAAQQQLTDAAASVQSEIEARLAEQVKLAQTQIQEFVESAVARLKEGATQTANQSAADLRAQTQEQFDNELQQRMAALREAATKIAAETEERVTGLRAEILGKLQENSALLEHSVARAGATASQLDQYSERLGTAQQYALQGFQSQLDDVLSLHRNELHRRSETLFDDLNTRIRQSFSEASQDAVRKFDEQVRTLAGPHIERTNEAISRMAGGRSLLDASLSLQQERIRSAADEAFAESLARFRENLGGVEQLLQEASQGVIGRNLAELESKAGDIRHGAGEEIYKTAEWYEKKVQTQLNGLTDKMVEQGGHQLRERAGEVSAEFAAELDHASRNFVGHTQNQMKEVVRESFDRARELFAEAADTTTAAFMDEIQRHARQELHGFEETVAQTAAQSNQQFAASRETLAQRLTEEQESFLKRFQAGMATALEIGVREAQEKINDGFVPLWESWKAMTEKQQEEMRASMADLSSAATGDFKTRLDYSCQAGPSVARRGFRAFRIRRRKAASGLRGCFFQCWGIVTQTAAGNYRGIQQSCAARKLLDNSRLVNLTLGLHENQKAFPQSVTRRHGHGFGIFRSELLVIRILLAQFAEQSLRQGVLLFTACGEGQDNFGVRPEIAPVFYGPGDLLHTEFFVTVNSTKPEREARTAAL